MNFALGVLSPDHPDVIAALHKMRVEPPSVAVAAKIHAGYAPDALWADVRVAMLPLPGIRQD